MKNDREPEDAISTGVSRRDFLGIAGAGVVGAAVAGAAAPAQAQCDPATEALPRLTLTVNGQRRSLQVEPRWTLLYVLREKFGMTGTKVSCERGECGACTVLIDGEPRYSCMTLALEAEGKSITTIEGLMQDRELGPVQQAFVEKDGMQCGYCTPGQVMAAEGLLRHKPEPSIDEIRAGMSGNLCRCGSYRKIIDSVQRAAELRKGTK